MMTVAAFVGVGRRRARINRTRLRARKLGLRIDGYFMLTKALYGIIRSIVSHKFRG